MTSDVRPQPCFRGMHEEWRTCVRRCLWSLLLGIGIYAVLLAQTSPAWRYIGGGVLLALGSNAVYGGLTGKRPWISKIGPLP
nr:putative integron gene cassette protein [uncultured bacterium]